MLRFMLTSALLALIGVCLPPAPMAAAGDLIDLRHPGWDAYLDEDGDQASATTNSMVLNQLFSRLAPGSWVILPDDAVYATDDAIRLPVDGTVVTGTATMRSFNTAASAMVISGDRVRVSGVRVRGSATLRSQQLHIPASGGFVIDSAIGTVLTDIRVQDVAGVGVMVLGALLFEVTRPVIVNTQADGIHMTSASAHGVLNRPAIFGSGDDGVAVVSYVDNAGPTSNVTVNDPVVIMSAAPPNFPHTFAWGRAYAVSGGTNITFNRITAYNSASASVYVAAEPLTGWNTGAVSGVHVNGGLIVNANVDRTLCAKPTLDCVDHGAVLVWGAQPDQPIDDVTIEGLRIVNTNASASWQMGILAQNGAGISRVLLRDLQIEGGPSTHFFAAPSVPTTSFSTVCIDADDVGVLPNHLGFQPLPEPGVTCGTPTE